MWEEEVFPRALQNHLLQAKHLTTLLALWIPQYLFKNDDSKRQSQDVLDVHDLRAGVWRQFNLFFCFASGFSIHTVLGHTSHTLQIVVIVNLGLFVVFKPAASGARQVAPAEISIKDALIVACVDSRTRVGDEVVSEVRESLRESSLHECGRRLRVSSDREVQRVERTSGHPL